MNREPSEQYRHEQARCARARALRLIEKGDRPAAEALLRLAFTLEPERLRAVFPRPSELN